jgi:hypothetical protein
MIFAILFPLFAFAHIIQDDISVLEKSRHSLNYVCSKSGYPDSPLIEVVSGTKIDCMSKKVDVGDFCARELAADPYYLRGYVDKNKQEVVCVSGKRVLFKYLCVKLSDRELCSSGAERACAYIKRKLAYRLDTVHSAFITNPKGIKQLNCFFESVPMLEK